jgi:hypothetical protein
LTELNVFSGFSVRKLRIGMTNKCGRQRFAIGAPSDTSSTFAVFGIDPGDTINYYQGVNVVTHRAPSLDYSPFITDSSFLLTK